jgi:hypothetical protein
MESTHFLAKSSVHACGSSHGAEKDGSRSTILPHQRGALALLPEADLEKLIM